MELSFGLLFSLSISHFARPEVTTSAMLSSSTANDLANVFRYRKWHAAYITIASGFMPFTALIRD